MRLLSTSPLIRRANGALPSRGVAALSAGRDPRVPPRGAAGGGVEANDQEFFAIHRASFFPSTRTTTTTTWERSLMGSSGGVASSPHTSMGSARFLSSSSATSSSSGTGGGDDAKGKSRSKRKTSTSNGNDNGEEIATSSSSKSNRKTKSSVKLPPPVSTSVSPTTGGSLTSFDLAPTSSSASSSSSSSSSSDSSSTLLLPDRRRPATGILVTSALNAEHRTLKLNDPNLLKLPSRDEQLLAFTSDARPLFPGITITAAGNDPNQLRTLVEGLKRGPLFVAVFMRRVSGEVFPTPGGPILSRAVPASDTLDLTHDVGGMGVVNQVEFYLDGNLTVAFGGDYFWEIDPNGIRQHYTEKDAVFDSRLKQLLNHANPSLGWRALVVGHSRIRRVAAAPASASTAGTEHLPDVHEASPITKVNYQPLPTPAIESLMDNYGNPVNTQGEAVLRQRDIEMSAFRNAICRAVKEYLAQLTALKGETEVAGIYFPYYGLLRNSGALEAVDMDAMCDVALAVCNVSSAELQHALEADDIVARCKSVLRILKRESAVLKRQEEYRSEIEKQIADMSRRYIAQEVIRRARREMDSNSSSSSSSSSGASSSSSSSSVSGTPGSTRGMDGGKLGGVPGSSPGGEPELEADEKTRTFRERLLKFDAAALKRLRAQVESEEAKKKSGGETSSTTTGTTTTPKSLHQLQLEEQKRVAAEQAKKEREFWEAQEARGGTPLSMPLRVRTTVEEELTKLEGMEKMNAEFHLTRNYLDWLTIIPWGRTTADYLDVARAKTILDADHYGMKEVKERILEFVAVNRLRGVGQSQGKIICLLGPPGVGKTSIGESIARTLGRRFYRFPVGGLHDVSEIKGHRRTYVGAMPGKLAQIFRTTQVMNPLVLIDEIDKVGSRVTVHGDPTAALLELLDPAQNTAFTDHYLDVPLDASKVLFVCTANEMSGIPAPLLDRLEVIRLTGYDNEEKIKIARSHLEPRALKDSGLYVPPPAAATAAASPAEPAALDPSSSPPPTSAENNNAPKVNVKISDEALSALTRWYAREAGVRNLQKLIERIYRKVALEVVEAEQKEPLGSVSTPREIVINESDLEKYVGKRKYAKERLFGDVLLPGIVMGLAFNGQGGAALYVEATALPTTYGSRGSKNATNETPSITINPVAKEEGEREDRRGGGGGGGGSIQSTGRMGDTMKESTAIAFTNVKRELLKQFPSKADFFERHHVHIHIPDGATPKDGPSAGITLSIALMSLALEKPVSSTLAMTGEISLTGKVLQIGGVREKVVAARRSGIKTLMMPLDNQKDWEELPEHLTKDMEVKFVDNFEEAMKVVGFL